MYVIADGARTEADREKVAAARSVIDTVDWACTIQRLYSEPNLGVGERFPTGMDWLFSQVNEAIILEDDVLPHPSFFRFCAEILERYRADERVGLIGGANHAGAPQPGQPSYRFTHSLWHQGLAMWRRTWAAYEHHCESWGRSDRPRHILEARYTATHERASYLAAVERAYRDPYNEAYDYKLSYSWTAAGQWAITPTCTSVCNIGFGAGGIHCLDPRHPDANLPIYEIPFPLIHPAVVPERVTVD